MFTRMKGVLRTGAIAGGAVAVSAGTALAETGNGDALDTIEAEALALVGTLTTMVGGVVVAGLAIFAAIWGVRLIKRALRAGS